MRFRKKMGIFLTFDHTQTHLRHPRTKFRKPPQPTTATHSHPHDLTRSRLSPNEKASHIPPSSHVFNTKAHTLLFTDASRLHSLNFALMQKQDNSDTLSLIRHTSKLRNRGTRMPKMWLLPTRPGNIRSKNCPQTPTTSVITFHFKQFSLKSSIAKIILSMYKKKWSSSLWQSILFMGSDFYQIGCQASNVCMYV